MNHVRTDSRFVMLLMLLGAASCATTPTTEFDRRAALLAEADGIDRESGRGDPLHAELLFKVSQLRIEHSIALGAARSGAAARVQAERALDDLDYVIARYPSYERRSEALFWRAETLSALHRWREAAAAWKAVPLQKHEEDRRHASTRLREAMSGVECIGADAGCP